MGKIIKAIKGTLHRSVHIETREVDEENRTVELAFSSEQPVQRYYGAEILDHGKNGIDLSRMNNGGAVLVDHDCTQQVGVVEKAWVDSDKKARALVRFGNSERAQQEFEDVKDGIRQHVSVGYQINELKLEKSDKKTGDTYRATRWTPYEISFVAIPADTTVGVGRSDGPETVTIEYEPEEIEETRTMDLDKNPAQAANPAQAVNVEEVRRQAAADELSRVREIRAMAEQHNFPDLGRQAIDNGTSVEDFRRNLLDELGKPKAIRVPENAAAIGMDEREVKNYNIVNAINALLAAREGRPNPWEKAGLERAASDAVAQRMGKSPEGFFLPLDIMVAKRDLTVGTPADGGNLVATNLLSASFIDLLRNAMVVMNMGVQTLSGLIGNIAIPRQYGAATAYWVAEGNSPTESKQAFDQVAMSPKTVGAFTDISRKLLLQSSVDVQNMVIKDLAMVLGLALQSAIINGTGSGQPTGILNTSGIGAVAGGTNGLAIDWNRVVQLETEVSQDNALLGNLGYLTNTKVRGSMKTTLRSNVAGAKYLWDVDNAATPINGYKAEVTNAVPSNGTKGTGTNLSSIIFGNFADVILGLWGGLDVMIDPYTNSTSGTVRVVNLQDVDVAIRHAESFSAMTDIVTS